MMSTGSTRHDSYEYPIQVDTGISCWKDILALSIEDPSIS